MSRRKGGAKSATQGVPHATRDGAPSPALNAPFAALRKQLRERQPESVAPATAGSRRKPGVPGAGSAHTPSAAADHADEVAAAADIEAFRKAVGAVLPVRKAHRAELDAPRPAPVPRQRVSDDEDGTASTRSSRSQDPLRQAYEGVVPLRDSGRIALDTPRRHAERTRGASSRIHPVRPDALILPADLDLHDPAALFRCVVGEAQPVDQRNRIELEKPAPAPAPLKREEDERAALDEALAAPLTFEDRLDMGDEAAFLRTGLPRRVLTDLRRGRWVLQGQIDLHGLTRDEARSALAHFLHDMLAQGQRCIRVIHGKGHGSPGKVSILKQLSRGWLAQREEILAFCQAGPHDGGSGALLVLLRAQNAAPR